MDWFAARQARARRCRRHQSPSSRPTARLPAPTHLADDEVLRPAMEKAYTAAIEAGDEEQAAEVRLGGAVTRPGLQEAGCRGSMEVSHGGSLFHRSPA